MAVKEKQIKHSLLEVLEKDGHTLTKSGNGKFRINPCPICGQNDHFTYYEETDSYSSFSQCCQGGDVYTYLIETNKATDYHEAYQLLEGKKVSKVKKPVKVVSSNKDCDIDFTAFIHQEHSLGNHEYFLKRGLSQEIIDKYKLSTLENGLETVKDSFPINEKINYISKAYRHMLPIWNVDGKCNYFITRVDETQFSDHQQNLQKTHNLAGFNVRIFNDRYLMDKNQTGEHIFIVEGIFDALSIEMFGYSVIALNSTSNLNKVIKMIAANKEELKEKTFIIIGDNDQAGQKMKFDSIKAFRKLGLNFISEICPKEDDDINGMLVESKDDLELFLQEVIDRKLTIIPELYLHNKKFNTVEVVIKKKDREGNEVIEYDTVINCHLKITDLYKNVETGTTNYKVEWTDKRYKNQSTIQPASTWGKSNKITDMADLGIPINTINSGKVVKYLESYRHYNERNLNNHDFIERLGFFENTFIMPNQIIGERNDIHFIPSEGGDKQYAKHWSSKGTFEEWKENILNPIKDFPYAVVQLLGSVGSVLLKDFNIKSFILEVSGNTSQGKTVGLKTSATVWGDPEGIVAGWNSTPVAIERRLALLCNLPLFLDDTKNGNKFQIPNVVYQHSLGVGKTRGNTKGTQQSHTWNNILMSTGESKITEFSEHGGNAARVLAFNEPPFGNDDQTELIDDLEYYMNEFYGIAGVVFLEWYMSLTDEELKQWKDHYRKLVKEYQKQAKGNNVVKRTAKYMAILHTTCLMVNKAWNTDIDDSKLFDVWKHEIGTNEEIDKPLKAMNVVLDVCDRSSNNFMTSAKDFTPNQYWGDKVTISGELEEIAIIPTVLKDILTENGFEDSNTILTEWRKRGWLDCQEGKFSKNRRIFLGGQKKMVRIIMDNLPE